MRLLLLTLCLPLLSGLVGCAGLPAAGSLPPRPARGEIAAFAIEARIAVRQGESFHGAHLSWRHEPQRDEILVSGPLGQGIARLTRDVAGARLLAADRREYAARDLSELSEKIFGTALPLDEVARWLPGKVADARTDALGRPVSALAQGWRIDYPAYESDAADALPATVELRRDDLEVKLKIDQWQID